MRSPLARRSPERATSDYDAFISYSHAEDDALAATLQAGLETFATPWFRPRTLRVFRDTTDLTATPGLLSEITGALSAARWFILVASERAAHSRWVGEEVSWWLANKDHKRFLIALSSGEIVWAGRDFDRERTTALPAVLAGAFTEEPGWIDLRKVKRALLERGDAAERSSPHRLARYQARRQVGDWVAALAAPIRGTPKDTLVGEHLRYRRQTRRVVQAVLAVMLSLTVGALAAAAVAVSQLAAARTQTRIATSRELAALSETLLTRHLDLAELFAVEAYRLNPSGQAKAALFQAVTASPHLVTYLSAGDTVSAVAGSADGRVVVAGRSDGSVLRWSLPDARPVVIARMKHEITAVSVNGNGSAVAAVSQGRALRWDAGLGVRLLRLPAGQTPIGVGISASGHFIAMASEMAGPVPNFRRFFKLTIFGPDAGQVDVTDIKDDTLGDQYLTFSSNAELVSLNSVYGSWQRLSVPGLRLLGSSPGGTWNTSVTTLSPGGGFISAANGLRTIPIWDIRKGATGEPFNIPIRGADPSAVAINSPGTLIAQAADGFVYVSSITRGRASSSSLTLNGISVVNDGNLTFAGRSELISASGGLLALWNLKQYSRVATKISFPAPQGCTACRGPGVSVRPDGNRVAVTAGGGYNVAVQNLAPGARSAQTSLTAGTNSAPLWMPDGKHLLVPLANGGAKIWSAAPGFTLTGKWGHTKSASGTSSDVPGAPMTLVSRPDERTIIEVFANGAMMVRDSATGRIEESIAGPPSLAGDLPPSASAAVDAAGRVAAVVTPRGVVVTELTTRHRHILPGNPRAMVAFNGEQLLVQQPDGRLQIWDADATRLLKTIAGVAATVAGPVVGQNGLATEASSDGSAVVIDLHSGVTLGSFPLPSGPYFYSTGLGMSSDGRSLVTVTEAGRATGEGLLTDWRMSVGTWLKVACQSAGHALTDADWQEYVGGSPPGQLACGPGSA